jgi:outer membrane protein OmpA-like peptidoglycan-associated protein
MRLRNALLAATLLTAVSGAALAQGNQHPKGFYVGGALGANITGDLDAKINSTSLGVNNNNLTFDMKTGYAVLGAVGYAYGNGLRTEIEPGYRRNSIDGVSGAAAAANLSGKLDNLSVMLNAIYDINIGSALVPYLGAGLGTSRVNGKVDGEGDSKWKLAYQGIAGVAYSLNNQVKLDLGYRYFATPDVKVGADVGTIEYENTNHSVLLGLRYHFAPPAPAAAPVAQAAPAPAPAPAPVPKVDIQRSFLVFFDFDKSDITTEAARVIAQAADHAKRGGIARIVVTGHTDTSGAPAYNQRLSERRAANVREALVRQGMAANAISTVGKGESDPLVKTGDGVREAQNRRAEIVLQ